MPSLRHFSYTGVREYNHSSYQDTDSIIHRKVYSENLSLLQSNLFKAEVTPRLKLSTSHTPRRVQH